MEIKKPTDIKRLVVKWQRALVMPFHNAIALEAHPLQLVASVFTGKRKILPAKVIYTEKRKQYNHS